MGGKAKKGVNAPKQVPVQHQPQRKQHKKKDDDHHRHQETRKDDHSSGHFRGLFIGIICISLSLWMIHLCPLPQHDVKKQPHVSFLGLYLTGLLDHVENITQMLLASGFSLFLDIFVVTFHFVFPPHPKFVLSFKRKLSIYLHLFAGVTEIVSGVLAFTLANDEYQRMFSQIMSSASILHSITAYYQTGIVFGAKGVMVPGYIYAITLHIVNAYRSYTDPGSLVYMLYTFLLLHIYVWCRFFIFFFRACNMFVGNHYTVAITLSGLLLFPFSVGPIGNFGMLFVVVAYCGLELLLTKKTGKAITEKLFEEHERYALISGRQLNDWREDLQKTIVVDKDRQAARLVFDNLHAEPSADLRSSEVYRMVRMLNIPDFTIKKVMALADKNNDGFLSFNEFYRYIWSIGSAKSRIIDAIKHAPTASHSLSPREQAMLVFQMIDIDNTGNIELAEIEMLLTQWGMPYNEAQAFIDSYGDHDHKVSFEEFYKRLQPVWSFAFTFLNI